MTWTFFSLSVSLPASVRASVSACVRESVSEGQTDRIVKLPRLSHCRLFECGKEYSILFRFSVLCEH